MKLPDNVEDFKAFLKAHAAHGVQALEGWIVQFNRRATELHNAELRRQTERERYVLTETNARYEAWVEAEKKRHAQEAAADFDLAHPPIRVPALIHGARHYAAEAVKAGKHSKDTK